MSNILLSNLIKIRWIAIFGQLIAILFVYFILKSTKKIERLLGKGGINVLRRIFGIVLLAIAIKLAKLHIAF